jgi:ATPase subunit of ABC transporter with duplicated ATPase domains
MEVLTVTPPRRNRCGLCRQVGHNRSNCPHTTVEATRLRVAFNAEQRQERRQLHQRLQQSPERQSDTEFRESMYAQVVDMQQRLAALVASEPTTVVPRSGPTVRERKIQEILFDNAQIIPDGLYKDLMDALVIRD